MDQNTGRERGDAEGPDASANRAAAAGGSAGDDAVLRALEVIRSAVLELACARLWSRSDDASREAVREGFSLVQSLQFAWLGLVADLDSRPEAVPGAQAGRGGPKVFRGGVFRAGREAGPGVGAPPPPGRGGGPQTRRHPVPGA